MRRRLAIAVTAVALLAATLAYLHDPPWLLSTTSGLHAWEAEPGGMRYRWMGAHASFFVPSDAHVLEIPLRTTFATDRDWPIEATVTIDDRPADRLVLSDREWHRSVINLPSPAGRRARRIDIRLDRVREDDRGAQMGELSIR